MIKRIIQYIRFYGGKYKCIACGKRTRTFFRFSDYLVNEAKKHGFSYDFKRLETLNYNLCNCPFCLTSDRERLYLIFLEKYIFKSFSYIKLLDFAPNPQFSNYIKRKKVLYTSADLSRKDVDVNLDICKMDIPDESFNCIICSHILEHVPSPEKALSELYRILKPDGVAIIMVPLFWDVTETHENANHITEEDRWKYYGQFDHVRLFGKDDFIKKIKNAGFNLKYFTIDDFDSLLISKNAISSNSVLYVGYKD